MDLKISTKEIMALLQSQPEIRYKYTLKRIADTECIWSIIGSDDSFAIQVYGDKRLFPIWSSKEYAQAFLVNNSAGLKSIAMTLDYFVDYIIDYISREELLINVFPTEEEPFDSIVEMNKFAEDLGILLEDYE